MFSINKSQREKNKNRFRKKNEKVIEPVLEEDLKYIVSYNSEIDGDEIFVFPKHQEHLGYAKEHRLSPVTAGFIDRATKQCHGISYSLVLKSNPEVDTELYRNSKYYR